MELLVLLMVAVVVLCVDIISSSSVMMEEVAGVAFDSGGGRGDWHFSHVTNRGHFTLGGVYCDEIEEIKSVLGLDSSSDVDVGGRSLSSNTSKQWAHICAVAAISSSLAVISFRV